MTQTTFSPELEAGLRQGFKHFNRFMLLLWRLGLGPWLSMWPDVGGQILVLLHVGKKTGIVRKTPLNFARVDGEIYITAGFGPAAHWYKNIQANPNVEIWLPEGRWWGVAEAVTDERRLYLLREVLRGSGIVAPLMGVNPNTLSADELEKRAGHYPVVHIRRTQAVSGSGGPGDLVWVWPLLALGLLLPRLFRRR